MAGKGSASEQNKLLAANLSGCSLFRDRRDGKQRSGRGVVGIDVGGSIASDADEEEHLYHLDGIMRETLTLI